MLSWFIRIPPTVRSDRRLFDRHARRAKPLTFLRTSNFVPHSRGAGLICTALLAGFGVTAVLIFLPRPTRAQAAQDVEWRHYGNDLGNMRFQDVDQINPRNVAKLGVAWVFHTGVLDKNASLEVSHSAGIRPTATLSRPIWWATLSSLLRSRRATTSRGVSMLQLAPRGMACVA